jgi:hypothetical protein
MNILDMAYWREAPSPRYRRGKRALAEIIGHERGGMLDAGSVPEIRTGMKGRKTG